MALLLMLLVPIPLMLAGYIVQIVLAIRGYLRAGGFVHTAPNRARLVAAAWATTIGGVLTAFFTVDGGDHEWGSTFMLWTGLASNSAAGDVSTVLAWIAASAWVLGWVWLVVEWILARRSPATGA